MTQTQEWAPLYRIGGIAALVAAVLFRRNIGAEVSLFTGIEAIPASAAEWFSLLQTNPFVGLSFLAVFDLVNYFLVGLVFLALAARLWPLNKGLTAMALASGLVGIAVSFASNVSFSMMSVSQQYAAATGETQRATLLATGQSLLAMSGAMGNFPGTGTYMSYLLIALAELALAVMLLPSHRAAAIVGLLAAGCDLAYCLTFALSPGLQVLFMASGGAFWMLWHLLAARLLFKAPGV
ncbi:MAG: hypothetical protein ACOYYS_03890 [Chloroflexota bacterium]